MGQAGFGVCEHGMGCVSLHSAAPGAGHSQAVALARAPAAELMLGMAVLAVMFVLPRTGAKFQVYCRDKGARKADIIRDSAA